MAGVLYQDQGGDQPVFIGAAGRKTTSYEANYHSSKGELAALNFALQKFQHLLLLNFSFFNFRIEHKPGKELVDADHISRQTNLPPATPSEKLETQEFEPTYPLPHPLDQWQHLVSHEDHDCTPLDRCPPCVQAMSQQGVAETLPPRLDPEPWPQPGDGRHTPVYPR